MPEIRGRLVRGLGEAPAFTQLQWVVDQCQAKLGFTPYPGTVNLEVLPEDQSIWDDAKRTPGIILEPPDNAFCDADCQPVTVGGIRAATIVPHIDGYPMDKLELLAPVPIVETLGLTLGQVLEIRIA